MKLTVLVDNNTYPDMHYYGESGISFFIENKEDKILFDVGYSNLFIKNALAMQLDINAITKIVISHGHDNHIGGLRYLADPTMEIITHPWTFYQRKKVSSEQDLDIKKIINNKNFMFVDTLYQVSDNLYYLGEIPTLNDFEQRKNVGSIYITEQWQPDYLLDDSALVYRGRQGLYIITGCSHSGICNIIAYAKQVLNEERVVSVIGGFHLFDTNVQVKETLQYFINNNIQTIYPCHCTSFSVKSLMNQYITVKEVGVGMQLVFD